MPCSTGTGVAGVPGAAGVTGVTAALSAPECPHLAEMAGAVKMRYEKESAGEPCFFDC
jgi:hypothetical protein